MKHFFTSLYTLCTLFTVQLSFSQTIVYTENCNTLGAWTNTGGIFPSGMTGNQYNFQAVVPVVPAADHTGGGGGVFYTNGNQPYLQAGALNYIVYRVHSPAINLTGWDNTRLEFWMQLRSETNNWDGAYIEYSQNGQVWNPITAADMCYAYDGNMSQNPSSTPYFPYLKPAWFNLRSQWTRILVNTSNWDNVGTFYIRFLFHSDEALAAEGWAIDDISIISVAIPRVEGNNVFIADNDLTPSLPDGTDFGAVPIGQCTTQTFYMHNVGESPLTLTGNPYVQVTGSAFSVLQQPANNVIPPGDSVAYQVQFCPTTIGTSNGTITIPNSDNYSSCSPPNPYNYAITGRHLNTPPVIAGLQDTLICVNSGPVVFNVTVSDNEQNAGTLTLSGTSSDQILVPNGNIVFGGSGANRTITITPAGGGIGGAMISITVNDGQTVNQDSTFTFNIFFGDTVAPVALCQDLVVQLDANGNGSITAAQANNGSSDNCGITQMTLSQSSFTCADAGVVPVDLIVEDAGGNISTCTFNVTVNPPAFNASFTTSDFNGFNISCANASDGSVQVTATGGCVPYTYVWSHDPNLQADAASNLPPGNYTVTITDAAGQQVVLNPVITEPTPLIDQGNSVNISCFGEMDGTIQLNVSGGVSPYQYNLGPSLNGLSAGVYNFAITDANNCPLASSYTITEPPQIFLDGVDNYVVFCKEATLLEINATGGTGNLTFQWEPADFLDCPTCEDPVSSPAKSTVYTVIVTDERGCQELMPVAVEVSCYAFIPNSFTPNNDGLNDIFFVESASLESLTVRIYNRWGEEVFFSSKLDYGWNGKKYNDGSSLPVGVYCYAIEITLPGEMPVVYRGNVNLIR